MTAPTLKIEYCPIRLLVRNSRNARTHSKRQIRQIAASINAFGFTNPVLVDRDNKIIAGHGRVSAAEFLGMDQVPTVRLDSLSQEQIRAYVLADNRLAEKAGWDKDILAIELQELINSDSLDITITGFEVPEIDLILEDARSNRDKDDDVEIGPTGPAVTQPDDVWHLGKHKLVCGNSLHESSYQALGKWRAQAVITDPPYNVRIDGNVCGKGAIKHREFAMAAGELSEAEYFSFLSTSLRLMVRYSVNGSVHYLFIDWRHCYELLAASRQIYEKLLNLCVWAKDNGGMGSFYRSRHELVFVFKNGKGQHRNNVQLGQFGRNRTNVWEYPGVNTLSKQGDEGNLLALHPTVKPVALIADAMLDCTARGDLVLDNFLGSGSTLMAAERVGRICYGIEIDPAYVDTAVRRWQRLTGENAIYARNGKTFDQIAGELEESHG